MQRTYKIPQGYPSWGDIIKTFTPHPAKYPLLQDLQDTFESNRTPVYCIKKSLIEEFQQTYVGTNIGLFLELALPQMMFVFPKGIMPSAASKDGYIKYVLFSMEEFGNNKEFKYQLRWSGFDSQHRCFFSAKNIRRDGSFKQLSFTGDETLAENSYNLQNIILQSLLFLQHNISETPEALPIKKGFASKKGKKEEDKLYYPRWLEDSKKKHSVDSSRGNGSEKSTHWRRGHWRHYENGNISWVRPALIKGESCEY